MENALNAENPFSVCRSSNIDFKRSCIKAECKNCAEKHFRNIENFWAEMKLTNWINFEIYLTVSKLNNFNKVFVVYCEQSLNIYD